MMISALNHVQYLHYCYFYRVLFLLFSTSLLVIGIYIACGISCFTVPLSFACNRAHYFPCVYYRLLYNWCSACSISMHITTTMLHLITSARFYQSLFPELCSSQLTYSVTSYLKLSLKGYDVQNMVNEKVPIDTAVRERQCQVSFLNLQRIFHNFSYYDYVFSLYVYVLLP
jgi:hypothetical protein